MSADSFGLPEPVVVPKAPKVPKAKSGTIKVEPMTLDQFRSYLKGIMFVGGPTWRPDRDQWEAIVAIIDKLTVTESAPVYNTPVPMQYAPQYSSTQPWEPPASAIPRASQLDSDDGVYQTPYV